MRWMVSSDEPVGAWAMAGLHGGTEYQKTLGSAMVKEDTPPETRVKGVSAGAWGEAGGVAGVGSAPALPSDARSSAQPTSRLNQTLRFMLPPFLLQSACVAERTERMGKPK